MRWKRILLCVTGGIAAYKAADLASQMIKQGAEVRAAMTANATKFVGPLTFQALTGKPVITDMFELGQESRISHIDMARHIDAAVIAPCTANVIGKLANGIADDWITTTLLATRAPRLICPAMNSRMFENSIVQENLSRLAAHGYIIAPTGYGALACGEVGAGRLLEPEQILERIEQVLAERDLTGLKFLVTAGPTREFIDPVRYLSNPSSGKMGYACARAAARRGAEVVLVSGPAHLPRPEGVKTIMVTTAEEMLAACLEHFVDCHAVIKAAAVGDYTMAQTLDHKAPKTDRAPTLDLILAPDILFQLGQRKKNQVLVGFAAETQKLIDNASGKMKRKNLDMIVANNIAQEGAGFGTDTNIVKILAPDAPIQELPLLPKDEVADIVIDRAVELIRSRE